MSSGISTPAVTRRALTYLFLGLRLTAPDRHEEKPAHHAGGIAGALKIIAAIEDPPVIDKILSHLGLPTRAPPRAPARRVDLFQTT